MMKKSGMEVDFGRKAGFTLIEILLVIITLAILAAIGIPHFTNSKKQASDTAARGDLRQAYVSAIAFFSDFPRSRVTLSRLQEYGFTPTENVVIRIEKDRLQDFLMYAAYNGPATQVYFVDSKGVLGTANISPSQLFEPSSTPSVPSQGTPGEGGVPGGGVIPPNQVVEQTLKMAYSAAMNFFDDHPTGNVTVPILEAYGFVVNPSVSLAIADGTLSGFLIIATSNARGGDTYTVDATGKISSP